MARLFDYLNDAQRNEKIHGSRLNDDFDQLNNQHPASSTDNAIARYDGATGTLQNSAVFIDDSARLLLGHATALDSPPESGADNTPSLQVHGTGANTSFGSLFRWSNSNAGPRFSLNKSRGATVADYTVAQSGDTLGAIIFSGSDGTNFEPAAAILGVVGGTPGSDDMPGRLSFWTTSDGGVTPVERMWIDSAGVVTVNGTSALTNTVLNLIDIRHATSGTPASGIGVGLQFTQETAADNHEAVAQLTVAVHDVTGGSEDADLRAYLMSAGTLVERFKFSSDGQIALRAPLPNLALVSESNEVAESLGSIDFRGLDSAANQHTYTVLDALIETATNGSEGGSFIVKVSSSGTITECLRIDQSGAITNGGADQLFASAPTCLQLRVNTATDWTTVFSGFSADANGPEMAFSKSRNATFGSHTIVNNDDVLGRINFYGSDGDSYVVAGRIFCAVAGVPGDADMPGRIGISTTLDGGTAPREGLRVDGTVTAGNTALMIYDVDNATLERVTVGTANSGGTGFKLLRIPN